jgi:hypothetical protein
VAQRFSAAVSGALKTRAFVLRNSSLHALKGRGFSRAAKPVQKKTAGFSRRFELKIGKGTSSLVPYGSEKGRGFSR